jgi:SAM-dependent methyltransferase
MLEQAREVQSERGVANVAWDQGDVTRLPYKDGEFSIVATRFTFHHFLDPLAVLKEMRRVCRPGGRIVVADSAPAPAKADAFNLSEKLRDPSHTRAMPLEELCSLFAAAGLGKPQTRTYRFEGDLDDLLKRSCPNPGDEGRVRAMYEESLEDDALDMHVRRENGKIHYAFPIAILAAENPAWRN